MQQFAIIILNCILPFTRFARAKMVHAVTFEYVFSGRRAITRSTPQCTFHHHKDFHISRISHRNKKKSRNKDDKFQFGKFIARERMLSLFCWFINQIVVNTKYLFSLFTYFYFFGSNECIFFALESKGLFCVCALACVHENDAIIENYKRILFAVFLRSVEKKSGKIIIVNLTSFAEWMHREKQCGPFVRINTRNEKWTKQKRTTGS